MKWGASIKGWLAAFGVPVNDNTERALAAAGVAVDEEVKDAPEPPDPATFAAGEAAARAVAETAQAQATEERRRRIAGEAEAFVTGHIGKRLVPAAKAPLLALFARCAEDDATAAAVVTFGEGDAGTGGRVECLRALINALPETGLTEEQLLAVKEGRVEFKANGEQKNPEERKKALMELSALGRAALRKDGK